MEELWWKPTKEHRRLLTGIGKTMDSYLRIRREDLEDMRKFKRNMTLARRRGILEEMEYFKNFKGSYNLTKYEFLKETMTI